MSPRRVLRVRRCAREAISAATSEPAKSQRRPANFCPCRRYHDFVRLNFSGACRAPSKTHARTSNRCRYQQQASVQRVPVAAVVSVFRTVAARLLNGDARFHDRPRSVHHCRKTQRITQPSAQPNAANLCTPQRGRIAMAHNMSAQCVKQQRTARAWERPPRLSDTIFKSHLLGRVLKPWRRMLAGGCTLNSTATCERGFHRAICVMM